MWYYLETYVIFTNLAKNFIKFQDLASSKHYNTCLMKTP